MSEQSFLTDTLVRHPYGQSVARVLAAVIQAVEPGSAVRRFVRRRKNVLLVNGQELDLAQTGRIVILGLGKAAWGMAQPLVELLADRNPRGVLIPKQAPAEALGGFEIVPGGHPLPDERSLLAGQKALELVSGLQENDLLLCLISGGGSALMTAPQTGISLAELRTLTSSLLACGARIDEINTLRRHLDRLKGGGLARAAFPARVISLILSDVVNNPLEAIASGPTAPDPSTRAEALGVLEKYCLLHSTPLAILKTLETAPETPKAGEAVFERVENILVGSNLLAAQAALAQAQSEGMQGGLLGGDWQGEARAVAVELCQRLKNTTQERPFCLVAGGETTVSLHGKGRGGRNQELALAAVPELDGSPDLLLVTLATDGEDGPTDAAGAVVSGGSLRRGQALGLEPGTFLNENNAYAYFEALGDLLKPGPSGTNVNDLTFLFGF